ncbi:phosphatase PAP2 family protein [Varunaivibrio sulfuroxidans]|uniref:Undecaprenyl-diphosphatase n=1 Tax=Varunaivibrio sulfuroxidans TaxID=1773489 RepID=A0A4R3J6W0_9PROT|nr:phosphatase PAP2 family protein [Varunaivibrio sulfuroxidans]TCS61639.1 undecaprenyl-diphosphatase [Varunaivibrio sulfuroxidans]WES29489.1 phosphatase PAP2 family protein [Varunaivibrio sulfuroxidans]
METHFPLNVALFHAINADPDASPIIVNIARVIASSSPEVVIVLLLLVWFRHGAAERRALMVAGVATLAGLAINFIFASTMYAPRPFELGIGRTLLAHRLETSFPSDHVTFLLSLGFGLLASRGMPRLAWVLIGVGVATAWARVYLGVHFPLDMAGSAVISLSVALLSATLAGHLDGIFFARVERVHRALVSRFAKTGKK